MKLPVFNKPTHYLEGRFIALFQDLTENNLLSYADGYNSPHSTFSLYTEDGIPSSLKEHFAQLSLECVPRSYVSGHTNLLTLCDPEFFNLNYMRSCYVIKLLNNDEDFMILDHITDFDAWFEKYPYPKN